MKKFREHLTPAQKSFNKLYNRTPIVVETDIKGNIITVQRHYDNAFISVGMETKSGKIISIQKDRQASGNMSATMEERIIVAIPCISL